MKGMSANVKAFGVYLGERFVWREPLGLASLIVLHRQFCADERDSSAKERPQNDRGVGVWPTGCAFLFIVFRKKPYTSSGFGLLSGRKYWVPRMGSLTRRRSS